VTKVFREFFWCESWQMYVAVTPVMRNDRGGGVQVWRREVFLVDIDHARVSFGTNAYALLSGAPGKVHSPLNCFSRVVLGLVGVAAMENYCGRW
jgi:hypothetical protein